MYIIIVIIVVVVVARGGGVGDSDGVTEVIMLTDRHTHRQQSRKTKKYVTHLKRRVITKWMVTPNQHSVKSFYISCNRRLSSTNYNRLYEQRYDIFQDKNIYQ